MLHSDQLPMVMVGQEKLCSMVVHQRKVHLYVEHNLYHNLLILVKTLLKLFLSFVYKIIIRGKADHCKGQQYNSDRCHNDQLNECEGFIHIKKKAAI